LLEIVTVAPVRLALSISLIVIVVSMAVGRQDSRRVDARLHGEDGVVVVGDVERDGLAGLVRRAGADGRHLRRAVRAAVFSDGDGCAGRPTARRRAPLRV
jgi:hypothetical protein